ncbi:MAG TPA: hypothetical protein VF897_07930 [Roseiflexaceae bacterium]
MSAYEQAVANSADYDLFRRAIEQSDADAWTEISARYRRLLASWALRCGARTAMFEHCDDIADQALARAWSALSPAQFQSFPGLAALLAYLRTCVTATVIDHARAQRSQTQVVRQIEEIRTETPERTVLEASERAELWRLVAQVAQSDADRIVLRESLVQARPPRTIQRRHPEHFPDVVAVYRTKRNLLDRLQRNRDIQRLREEWRAA